MSEIGPATFGKAVLKALQGLEQSDASTMMQVVSPSHQRNPRRRVTTFVKTPVPEVNATHIMA